MLNDIKEGDEMIKNINYMVLNVDKNDEMQKRSLDEKEKKTLNG